MLGTKEGVYFIDQGGDVEDQIDQLQELFEKVLAKQEVKVKAYFAAVTREETVQPPYVLFVLSDLASLIGVIANRKTSCLW